MTTELKRNPSSKKKRWIAGLIIVGLLITLLSCFLISLFNENMAGYMRPRLGEGLVLASAAKNLVTDYYQTHGQLTWESGDPKANGIENYNTFYASNPTKNTQSIKILPDGTIEIQPTKLVGQCKLQLIPEETNKKIHWHCINVPQGGCTQQNLLPAECTN